MSNTAHVEVAEWCSGRNPKCMTSAMAELRGRCKHRPQNDLVEVISPM